MCFFIRKEEKCIWVISKVFLVAIHLIYLIYLYNKKYQIIYCKQKNLHLSFREKKHLTKYKDISPLCNKTDILLRTFYDSKAKKCTPEIMSNLKCHVYSMPIPKWFTIYLVKTSPKTKWTNLLKRPVIVITIIIV